jgi:hypothetical protein
MTCQVAKIQRSSFLEIMGYEIYFLSATSRYNVALHWIDQDSQYRTNRWPLEEVGVDPA